MLTWKNVKADKQWEQSLKDLLSDGMPSSSNVKRTTFLN